MFSAVKQQNTTIFMEDAASFGEDIVTNLLIKTKAEASQWHHIAASTKIKEETQEKKITREKKGDKIFQRNLKL